MYMTTLLLFTVLIACGHTVHPSVRKGVPGTAHADTSSQHLPKVLRDELAAKIGQAGLRIGQDKDHYDLLYAQTIEMLEQQHPDLLRNIEDLEATLETRSLNELPALYYHRYRFILCPRALFIGSCHIHVRRPWGSRHA